MFETIFACVKISIKYSVIILTKKLLSYDHTDKSKHVHNWLDYVTEQPLGNLLTGSFIVNIENRSKAFGQITDKYLLGLASNLMGKKWNMVSLVKPGIINVFLTGNTMFCVNKTTDCSVLCDFKCSKHRCILDSL